MLRVSSEILAVLGVLVGMVGAVATIATFPAWYSYPIGFVGACGFACAIYCGIIAHSLS